MPVVFLVCVCVVNAAHLVAGAIREMVYWITDAAAPVLAASDWRHAATAWLALLFLPGSCY